MRLDTESPTWRVVREWAEKRLEDERASLEYLGCDEQQANHNRGAIDALRSLLALPDLKPPPSL